jgi:glycine/D-amino acid oxidase-like deaminating enzyme
MIAPATSPSKSYWLEALPPHLLQLRNHRTSPKLPTNLLDVVVIGSGMTGCSVAYHLSRSNTSLSVAVLESRGLCSGATGRNGGFLHAHGWNMWWPLMKKYGITSAARLVLLELAGRKAIHHVANKEQFDCELDRNVKLAMLFPTQDSLQQKLGVFHVLRHSVLSFCGLQVLDTKEEVTQQFNISTTSNTVQGAIVVDSGCDTFWPAKFVYEIFDRLIQRQGTEIHTNTTVLQVQRDTTSGIFQIETNRGIVHAKNVVHCSNAWIGGLVPEMAGVIQPVLNTVVSTVPQETPPLLRRLRGDDGSEGEGEGEGEGGSNGENTNVVQRRTGMDLQPGYHYWHQRENGRIILGGFRNNRPDRGVGVFDDGPASAEDIDYASTFLHDLGFFPDNKNEGKKKKKLKLEHAWTGIIGWSMDGMPFVGPWSTTDQSAGAGAGANVTGGDVGDVGDVGKEYICAGFSGHGMTQTWLCGRSIAESIAGGERLDTRGGYFPTEMLLPTSDRIENAQKKGSDWLAYEKGKGE